MIIYIVERKILMAKIAITNKSTRSNQSDEKAHYKASPAASPKAVSTDPTKRKSKSKTKNLMYPFLIIVGTVAIAAIVVLVLTLLHQPAPNEEYFTSDDTKSVITMGTDDPTSTDHQTHFVYEYDGDKVIGLKTYFEYQNTEAAKAAYESSKNLPEFKNSELNENFIIVTADPSQFEGLTADDVRQQEEAIKQYQASKKRHSEPDSEPKSEHSEDQSPEKNQ